MSVEQDSHVTTNVVVDGQVEVNIARSTTSGEEPAIVKVKVTNRHGRVIHELVVESDGVVFRYGPSW